MAMRVYDWYIVCVVVVKVAFVIALVLYWNALRTHDTHAATRTKQYKSKLEILFFSMMSLLLAFLFFPGRPTLHVALHERETQILLFMYGVVMLLYMMQQ